MFYFTNVRQVPDNSKQITEKIYDMVTKTGDVLISTDMYSSTSVKAMERNRRGSSNKLIVKGLLTEKPHDWKQFLQNEDNKKQLVQLMHKCWLEYVKENRKVILIKEGEAFRITRTDTESETIQELKSSQEETDPRVVLYCHYAANQGYRYCRIRSPDSDIFCILLHHARSIDTTILFDTGHGNKKRLINITKLAKQYPQHTCSAMLSLHALTGCDSVSSFKGIGKVKPLQLLLKSPSFCDTLNQLGEDWDVEEELLDDCDKFICAVYGKSKCSSVDEVRHIMLKSKCDGDVTIDTVKANTIDLARFPPSRACLNEHVARANYQSRIWKVASSPEPYVPNPWKGHGWLENGEPLWCKNDNILPKSLIDILDSSICSDEDDDIGDGGGDDSFQYDSDGDDSSDDLI